MLSATYTTVGRTQTATFTTTSDSGVKYSKFVSDLTIDGECNSKLAKDVPSIRVIADKYPVSLIFTDHVATATWKVDSDGIIHNVQLRLRRVSRWAKSQGGVLLTELSDTRPSKRPRTSDGGIVPQHDPFNLGGAGELLSDLFNLGGSASSSPQHDPFKYATYDERIRQNEELIANLQSEIIELKRKVNGCL